jgi:hypothetical protein
MKALGGRGTFALLFRSRASAEETDAGLAIVGNEVVEVAPMYRVKRMMFRFGSAIAETGPLIRLL